MGLQHLSQDILSHILCFLDVSSLRTFVQGLTTTQAKVASWVIQRFIHRWMGLDVTRCRFHPDNDCVFDDIFQCCAVGAQIDRIRELYQRNYDVSERCLVPHSVRSEVRDYSALYILNGTGMSRMVLAWLCFTFATSRITKSIIMPFPQSDVVLPDFKAITAVTRDVEYKWCNMDQNKYLQLCYEWTTFRPTKLKRDKFRNIVTAHANTPCPRFNGVAIGVFTIDCHSAQNHNFNLHLIDVVHNFAEMPRFFHELRVEYGRRYRPRWWPGPRRRCYGSDGLESASRYLFNPGNHFLSRGVPALRALQIAKKRKLN